MHTQPHTHKRMHTQPHTQTHAHTTTHSQTHAHTATHLPYVFLEEGMDDDPHHGVEQHIEGI